MNTTNCCPLHTLRPRDYVSFAVVILSQNNRKINTTEFIPVSMKVVIDEVMDQLEFVSWEGSRKLTFFTSEWTVPLQI